MARLASERDYHRSHVAQEGVGVSRASRVWRPETVARPGVLRAGAEAEAKGEEQVSREAFMAVVTIIFVLVSQVSMFRMGWYARGWRDGRRRLLELEKRKGKSK